jgi:ZIP family zinc transporter
MSEPAPPTTTEPSVPVPVRVPTWVKGLAPLVVLVLLVATFVRVGPVGVFRQAFPPVEELTVERITLPHAGEMRVRVVNGGPAPVTIAQVLVDDAAWKYTSDGEPTIDRLARREITIPYPWVQGEPHEVKLVSSTGLTFSGQVAVATDTPAVSARYISTFALLGVYAGVIPVFLGLLWLPFLRALERRWVDFFLSLTVGLLAFLGVEALVEALETAGRVPDAFQGVGLVTLGLLGAPLAVAMLSRRSGGSASARSAWHVASLIALGIGLHNLGEGLAIGASYASGEIALGTFLVIGFVIHNTTEGLGIVAPLATERPRLGQLAALGALAGLPTVIGTWIGGFTVSPIWATLFFAVGAGAIVQVIVELLRLFLRRPGARVLTPLNSAGLLSGLLLMYGTGLFSAA